MFCINQEIKNAEKIYIRYKKCSPKGFWTRCFSSDEKPEIEFSKDKKTWGNVKIIGIDYDKNYKILNENDALIYEALKNVTGNNPDIISGLNASIVSKKIYIWYSDTENGVKYSFDTINWVTKKDLNLENSTVYKINLFFVTIPPHGIEIPMSIENKDTFNGYQLMEYEEQELMDFCVKAKREFSLSEQKGELQVIKEQLVLEVIQDKYSPCISHSHLHQNIKPLEYKSRTSNPDSQKKPGMH